MPLSLSIFILNGKINFISDRNILENKTMVTTCREFTRDITLSFFLQIIYTGKDQATIANPASAKHHNELDKHTVTTKTSKINGEIL